MSMGSRIPAQEYSPLHLLVAGWLLPGLPSFQAFPFKAHQQQRAILASEISRQQDSQTTGWLLGLLCRYLHSLSALRDNSQPPRVVSSAMSSDGYFQELLGRLRRNDPDLTVLNLQGQCRLKLKSRQTPPVFPPLLWGSLLGLIRSGSIQAPQ